MAYRISGEEYEAIKKKKKRIQNKRISKRLKVLMLRYEGKKVDEIAGMLKLHKESITQMCRRYKAQGLEEYARNKYESHNRLLSKEQEAEIMQRFEPEMGKQVTAKEIKEALDEACGKDTGHMYVYNVMKRNGWKKKMPRSRHPKAANEEACEASKKLKLAWREQSLAETQTEMSD